VNPSPLGGARVKPQATGADGLPKGGEEIESRDDPPRGGYGKMQIEA